MVSYNWDFSVVWINKVALLKGLLITAELTILTLFFGLILGMLFFILKASRIRAVSSLFAGIIEIFRGLPLLVLMIWIFYTLPSMIGLNFSPFTTAVVALSLNLGAFSAEIFRSGFNSIPTGQIEAAKVVGMKRFHILRHIVFPQALKVIIPPLTGRFIETIKLTALASMIAVNELLHQGQNLIAVSYRPLEVYTVIAFMYLILIIPLSHFLKKMEAHHVRG
ncbi:amino acid ABC transporter permease [Candidatus Woesearchaeota archaeon]|nr:amino acid ABC transporter permease [Candidatus Woesearchaeota archaeon]